jgi:hypothetical protein
MTDF